MCNMQIIPMRIPDTKPKPEPGKEICKSITVYSQAKVPQFDSDELSMRA
jgi:hypothetical protein